MHFGCGPKVEGVSPRRLRGDQTLHVQLVGPLLGLPEIVVHLELHPVPRARAKALLRRTAMSGEIPARAFSSDESACRLTPRAFAPSVTLSPSGLQTRKSYMFAGVRWIVHWHRSSPHLV